MTGLLNFVLDGTSMEQSILNDPLLSPRQLATLLGHANPRTLDYWASVGKGPRRSKIEGKIAFRVSDIDEWLVRQNNSAAHTAAQTTTIAPLSPGRLAQGNS